MTSTLCINSSLSHHINSLSHHMNSLSYHMNSLSHHMNSLCADTMLYHSITYFQPFQSISFHRPDDGLIVLLIDITPKYLSAYSLISIATSPPVYSMCYCCFFYLRSNGIGLLMRCHLIMFIIKVITIVIHSLSALSNNM